MAKPLSIKEKRACELYALQGYTKTDAWRIGMDKRLSPEKQGAQPTYAKSSAWTFFNHPRIIDYVNSVLDTARAEDCMRVGRAVRELQDCIDEARDRKNDTAVSQLLDKKLKVMGLMRDRLVLSPESSLDDASLIEALSGGDAKKIAMLRQVLGRDGFKDTEH